MFTLRLMTGIIKNDQNVWRLDVEIAWLNHYGMIFHEQQWFPITTSGHVCLSGCVRMFFKHSWLRHLCLKIIPTRPLRHVWPEVVMENHTHTPAVHGKSHTYVIISWGKETMWLQLFSYIYLEKKCCSWGKDTNKMWNLWLLLF